ncbi:hypothetical protein G9A89_009938 [Geosiphon pyriformis]|nr:hypothetical protein G9A89_009938 [Geosiphon pyriformis]
MSKVNYLIRIWSTLDDTKAHAFTNVMCSEVKSVVVLKHLSLACKEYRKFKMHKSRLAKKASIRKMVARHMENFCSNKDSIIQSILEWPFCKVVLDHLVVNNELVLELKEIKLSVNKIMEGRIETSSKIISYFAVDAFVDDTIWIGNCQTSTQFALDIATKFFKINDIFINNKKTVAILINQEIKIASLNICGQSITIVKREWGVELENFLSLEETGSTWFCFLLLCDMDILGSDKFSVVKNGLHKIWSDFFKVFIDELLKDAGFADVVNEAAAYFLVLNLCINVSVCGLVSFTMAKLQTVALSLECVLSSSIVSVHLNSQAAINAYITELSSVVPDFHNLCWIKRHHIFNLIKKKNLRHLGVFGNVVADLVVNVTAYSLFLLLAEVCKHFLVAKNTLVFGNACHFVRDIFQSVCCACWEASPGSNVVSHVLIRCVNWIATMKVWYPNSHMLIEFTNQKSSNLHTYLIKAVHKWLSVEFSDHTFTYAYNVGVCSEVLAEASVHWFVLANSSILSASIDLVHDNNMISRLSYSVSSFLFNNMVKLLGVIESFAVSFDYHKPCNFFSGLSGIVQIYIGV